MAIACLMLVKNEANYAVKTLRSVFSFISEFVILDTGSTDGTVAEIKSFLSRSKLHLRESTFIDFETSRNRLMDFADEVFQHNPAITYYLLLDANDIWIGKELSHLGNADAFYITQRWTLNNGVSTEFKNIRLVARKTKWRYSGKVHEHILPSEQILSKRWLPLEINTLKPSEGIIFQDRCDDGGKSQARFSRDYELLKDATDSRGVFYMARTCASLGKNEEALKHYERRVAMAGFEEETYHSWVSIGELRYTFGSRILAIQAFERALDVDFRVEPLLALVQIYIEARYYHKALELAELACAVEMPERLLWVNKSAYTYKRWHILSGICLAIDPVSDDYDRLIALGKNAAEQACANDRHCNTEERALNRVNLKKIREINATDSCNQSRQSSRRDDKRIQV